VSSGGVAGLVDSCFGVCVWVSSAGFWMRMWIWGTGMDDLGAVGVGFWGTFGGRRRGLVYGTVDDKEDLHGTHDLVGAVQRSSVYMTLSTFRSHQGQCDTITSISAYQPTCQAEQQQHPPTTDHQSPIQTHPIPLPSTRTCVPSAPCLYLSISHTPSRHHRLQYGSVDEYHTVTD